MLVTSAKVLGSHLVSECCLETEKSGLFISGPASHIAVKSLDRYRQERTHMHVHTKALSSTDRYKTLLREPD